MSKRQMPPPTAKLTLTPKPASCFDRKLLAYALAGGAATAPASAAIIYSGAAQNVTVNYGSSAGIDFSGVGTAQDFNFTFSTSGSIPELQIGSSANQIAKSGLSSQAISFTTGASIDGTQSYATATKTLAQYSSGSHSGGNFQVGTSFVGVSLPTGIGSDVNYGWIRVTVPAASTSPLTIVDWAYQNTANTGILAGDTGQNSGSVPETGSTALFSLGAAGLCLWRARKRARRA
jgi:hypothetical protein